MGHAAPATTHASQDHQRRIGLTGGIASGKSSVGHLLLEQHGIPVLDADVYAREALAPRTPAARAVIARFGTGVLATGSDADAAVIDRLALGRWVFADAQARLWLERLVHPIVRGRFETELARLAEAPVVVLMIPLLFEAGLETLCQETWLVDCEPNQQLARLMARNGLSRAEAQARIDAQWPLARKRPLATVILDNRGEPAALAGQTRQALLG